MSENDPTVRRILPQNSQMNNFSFAPQQYAQRETQKNYVFVDEHNRHKRLKVMRACEGCRRRKIKCDAATTNTWPCSACIRLKLHCVRPNGYDGSTDSTTYEPPQMNADQFQQMSMQQQVLHTAPKPHPQAMYAPQQSYPDPNTAAYQHVPYDTTQPHNGMPYGAVQPPVSMMDHSYAAQNVFPTPPMQQQQPPRQESSPEAYSPGEYQHHDLADLLGTLKVNEAGTAPYLRNKASFRREEEPAVEESDDYKSSLPVMIPAPGLKIRIPPELMPDEETALHYFDLYFTHVHSYVPVLCKTLFYQQWNTDRESISPLILEALFAIGGRLAEDPTEGQQWLALATRHADSFMDVPRLSTLQALLMILKAREAAPKRGYYYRSWMTVVQCVQIGKDLGLDEHYEDHQAGRPCDYTAQECQLRTRIWEVVFVCECMVGTPQGRYDLAVSMDSVDFSVPRPIPGCDDTEYHVSRNFTYFARLVRSVGKMGRVYARVRRRKEWGIDPEFKQLEHSLTSWLAELPADLAITFPMDTNTPPWIPSHYLGNMHAYYYLTLILFHRPQLSFLEPTGADGEWKRHMQLCYSAAKAVCRLQETTYNTFGLSGLQCMQRGYSFVVYAGLSCIVIHLVAITAPDPEINSDARDFFTRHMRLLEKVMENWSMPELEKQINALREAFSADVRKPFVLKPTFPYGSPHPSTHSSPPQGTQGYRPPVHRTGSLDQALETQSAQQVSYTSHPITPPISAGPVDSKSDSPIAQSLVMMSQGTQAPGMAQNMPLSDQPGWNPSRIFEQWNSTFGTPAHAQPTSTPPQPSPLNVTSSAGATEVSTLQDIQAVHASLPAGSHQLSPSQYSAAPVASFVTPAMWQESVASVYEGGLKRAWDYDGGPVVKRH